MTIIELFRQLLALTQNERWVVDATLHGHIEVLRLLPGNQSRRRVIVLAAKVYGRLGEGFERLSEAAMNWDRNPVMGRRWLSGDYLPHGGRTWDKLDFDQLLARYPS